MKKKILFFSEAITLAHAARPFVLASSLNQDHYEVAFAWNRAYASIFPRFTFKEIMINSITTSEFLNKLRRGAPIYSFKQLKAYAEEDCQIIKAFKPDAIVGDFRLSLAVSARLLAIPYMNLTNAYWSPFAKPFYTVPEIPLTKICGIRAAQAIFNWTLPMAFAYHALPLRRLLKLNHLPPIGFDLRRTYTEGDYTFFCDIPDLVPTCDKPQNHIYLGPILWSPAVKKPAWWEKAADSPTIIYITLGSSGDANTLPLIYEAIKDLPISAIVANAERTGSIEKPSHIFEANYLPGIEAAALSRLVICNGGSPTTQQALSQGIPVIGIASNLDQYLNMYYLEKAGVGITFRSDTLNPKALRKSILEMLVNEEMHTRARMLKNSSSQWNPVKNFSEFMVKTIG